MVYLVRDTLYVPLVQLVPVLTLLLPMQMLQMLSSRLLGCCPARGCCRVENGCLPGCAMGLPGNDTESQLSEQSPDGQASDTSLAGSDR
jgi:hypothetical protein